MSRRAVLLLAILVAIVGIVALPSAAGLSDDGGQAADVEVNEPTAQTSDCSSCHGDAFPDGADSTETCESCHTEAVNQFEGSSHYGEDSHADITCTDCHDAPEDGWFMHFRAGPHGEEDPESSMAPEDNCAQSGCHGYGDESMIPEGKDSGVTHVSVYHPEYGEWNETEDADYDASSMASHSEETEEYAREGSCISCKSTEGAIANLDEPGIYDINEDDTPAAENVSEWRITCVACHEPHGITEDDTLRGDFESSSELCAQCHNTELNHGEFTEDVQVETEEVHHSQWEMFRDSKFADNSSSHPTTDCASCHMPMRDQQYEDGDVVEPQISGHDFEVDAELLVDENLMEDDYRKCGACHQNLDATIQEEEDRLESLANVAAQMRDSSNETIYAYGYEDDEELVNTWSQARFWVSYVEHGGTALHNPETASKQMANSIENFSEVERLANQQRVAELEDELDQASQEPQTTTTEEPEQTETETPGMGIGVALVALLGAALLAVRRWT